MSNPRKYRIPQESLDIKPIPEIETPTVASGVLQDDGETVILQFPDLDYPVPYPARLLDEMPPSVLVTGKKDRNEPQREDSVTINVKGKQTPSTLQFEPEVACKVSSDLAPTLHAIYINLPDGGQVVRYKIEIGENLVFKSESLTDDNEIQRVKTLLHTLSQMGFILYGNIKTNHLNEDNVWLEAIENQLKDF